MIVFGFEQVKPATKRFECYPFVWRVLEARCRRVESAPFFDKPRSSLTLISPLQLRDPVNPFQPPEDSSDSDAEKSSSSLLSTEQKLRPFDRASRIAISVASLSFGMLLVASMLDEWNVISMQDPITLLAVRITVLVLLASLVGLLLIKVAAAWVRWR